MAKVDKKVSLSVLRKANLPLVIVMGGPGSGKGTQCDKIKGKYGYTHLSTGDLLRDEVKSGTPCGKQINDIMAKGDLVPTDTVLMILKEAMVKAFENKTKGYLLDGYPRDVKQAEELSKQIGLPKVVIYLECSDEILIKRMIDRGKSSGRIDDNPESIKKRLETFKSQTIPVAAFYEKMKLIRKIPANRDVDIIFKDVCKILDAK